MHHRPSEAGHWGNLRLTSPREYAASATAALRGMLPILPVGFDEAGVLDVIEQTVERATLARKLKERERVAEVEAAAQQRLERLLSSSPAVVYSFAARGDFGPIFVSENLKRVFGYQPHEYMENGNFWRERVHPDDLDRVEAEVARLFGNGTHALEYRFRRRDGSYCWVSDQQHLVLDDDGEPLEVVGSWADITARKEAEAAKEAAHTRLTNLLAASPAVIYSFEVTGDFRATFVSQNIKDVLGYEPSQYLDDPDFWRRHVHPEDLAAAEAEFEQLMTTGRHSVSYRFLKPNGDYRWVNDEWMLVRDADGQPLEVVGSWSDITGRKEADAAAAAMRDRTRRLLGRAPAVIYAFNATGDFSPTFISRNVKKLLGYEFEEYLTDANFWLSRVHPEDIDRVTAEFPRLFEQDRLSYEYRFRRGDGSYCWVGDRLHLIRDSAGEPLEVVGSWSDITARKLAEDAKHELEQRLVDAIESIGEGFAFYDSDDRLVISNTRYREMLHADGMDEIAPGTPFELIIRRAVASGRIPAANAAGVEPWIEDRLRQHRDPGAPTVQRRSDGRWIQVSERRASLGGIVAVYSDLTELKENEERVAKAHWLILESLRYASRIQSAMLPNRQALASAMHDYFLIWEPRDIVGGDFFWFRPTDLGYFIIVGDCTGHGVPGAFMTSDRLRPPRSPPTR